MTVEVNSVQVHVTPNVGTTPVKVLRENKNRLGFSLWNDSTRPLTVCCTAASASVSTAVCVVEPGATITSDHLFGQGFMWTGGLWAVRANGSGNVVVHEGVWP